MGILGDGFHRITIRLIRTNTNLHRLLLMEQAAQVHMVVARPADQWRVEAPSADLTATGNRCLLAERASGTEIQHIMKDAERRTEVAELVRAARATLDGAPPSRKALAVILGLLEALAARRDLWELADFPIPANVPDGFYLISEEADRSFAVYLNVMKAGARTAPHNHGTWACVAAVEGCEYNYLYDRLDDGEAEGQARLRESSTVRVEPGRGIALMPDDIHAIEGKDDGVMRHLHFYGLAVEVLHERLIFDPAAGTCEPMPLATSIRG
jgi:predicted metal-dependent enzyme (double-stranded beta helix superfamily)